MKTVRERQLDWIARLRSGKYEQGRSCLRSQLGFCCLGVACDVLADEGLGEWSGGRYGEVEFHYFKDQSWEGIGLPEGAEELFGLAKFTDFWYREGMLPFRGREGSCVYLTTLNDEAGCTFDQIADVIEHFFLERE